MGSIWKSWDSNFLKGEGWGAKSVWVCPRFEEFSNGIHLHLIDKNLPQGWFYSQGNLGNAITVVIVINTSKYSGYENGNRGYIANFQCLTHWQKKQTWHIRKKTPQLATNTTFGPSVRVSYLRSLPTDQPHVSFWLSGTQGCPLITLLHLLDGPSCVIQGGQENNRVSWAFQTLCNLLAMLP